MRQEPSQVSQIIVTRGHDPSTHASRARFLALASSDCVIVFFIVDFRLSIVEDDKSAAPVMHLVEQATPATGFFYLCWRTFFTGHEVDFPGPASS